MTTISKNSTWHRILTVIVVSVNLVIVAGLLFSGYAGAIPPASLPIAPVAAMTFPLWLIGTIVILIADLFVRRKAMIIAAIGIAAALPPILEYSPFSLPSRESDSDKSFTLMSYNAFGFDDQTGEYHGGINPTISHILASDPDIVCLQEVQGFYPDESKHITRQQIDSLHKQYPYVYVEGHAQAILSKYPVEPVSIGFVYGGIGDCDIACFRVEISGRKITIFNIHLQSFDLLKEDRELFKSLTHLQGKEQLRQVRSQLIGKIKSAAIDRVGETEQLIKYIKRFGGPNVIVCGDFNDIPGCYSLRLLEKQHFKNAYSEVGFGPMITYNAERFYFRIDHVLYRGDLKPVSMRRGDIRTSDHYPIETKFVLSN